MGRGSGVGRGRRGGGEEGGEGEGRRAEVEGRVWTGGWEGKGCLRYRMREDIHMHSCCKHASAVPRRGATSVT